MSNDLYEMKVKIGAKALFELAGATAVQMKHAEEAGGDSEVSPEWFERKAIDAMGEIIADAASEDVPPQVAKGLLLDALKSAIADAEQVDAEFTNALNKEKAVMPDHGYYFVTAGGVPVRGEIIETGKDEDGDDTIKLMAAQGAGVGDAAILVADAAILVAEEQFADGILYVLNNELSVPVEKVVVTNFEPLERLKRASLELSQLIVKVLGKMQAAAETADEQVH